MSELLIPPAYSPRRMNSLTKNALDNEINVSISSALVGGVRQVSLVYDGVEVNIGGKWYTLPAGSIVMNTGDVAAPATYNIYAWDTDGTTGILVVSSTVNPETNPAVNYRYARIATVRFKSVGGVATIYFVRRAFVSVNLTLHHIGEYDETQTPHWVEGGALTVNATTGALSTTFLEYARLRFEAFIDPVVAGAILLDDESSVANTEAITTYADGSPITAGKYHKVLLGMIVGTDDNDHPYIAMRQNKPAVEYATLTEALNDSERMAANAFPAMYTGAVLPLYYVYMLKGDASDLGLSDLRATGVIGGGGGGTTGVTDHGLLSGLGDDDHLQYLRTDGGRTLTGNMAAAGGVTIDGVDISAHAANASAHHAPVTLGAGSDAALSLAGQELTLADVLTPTEHTAIGNTSPHHAPVTLGIGSDAALSLTGQELTLADVLTPTEHTAIGNSSPHHAPVTLGVDADVLLGLTGQQINLDSQTANTILAGPATAGPSDPTFRALVEADIPSLTSAKISDFNEAAQDAVGGILTNSANVSLVYSDAGNTITGDLITNGELAVTLANGVNNNINIGTALMIRVTGPTASFSVAGFTGGYAGRQLYVYNAAAQNMTADNEAGTSVAANRILTLGGGAATNGIGMMEFIYSGVDSRWILVAIRA